MVVSVVTDEEQVRLERYLLTCERESNKRFRKWSITPYKQKYDYINRIVLLSRSLPIKIYLESHQPTIDYDSFTIQTIGRSLLIYTTAINCTNYQAIILVDGLSQTKAKEYRRALSRMGLLSVAVRGVRDQSSAIIRLADSIVGFARDAQEGNIRFKNILDGQIRAGLITVL